MNSKIITCFVVTVAVSIVVYTEYKAARNRSSHAEAAVSGVPNINCPDRSKPELTVDRKFKGGLERVVINKAPERGQTYTPRYMQNGDVCQIRAYFDTNGNPCVVPIVDLKTFYLSATSLLEKNQDGFVLYISKEDLENARIYRFPPEECVGARGVLR